MLPTRSARITEAPVWKPVPVIVTLVPPAVRPWFGLMESTAGAGVLAENGKMQTPTAASMWGWRMAIVAGWNTFATGQFQAGSPTCGRSHQLMTVPLTFGMPL